MVAAVVEAESELAARSSSVPPTRFGIEARLAALKKAETEKSDAPTKYMSASDAKRFAARKPSASTARARSAAIITRRRFTRSTTTPATGPNTKSGRWRAIA